MKNAKKDKQLSGLFKDELPYITPHLTKMEKSDYITTKRVNQVSAPLNQQNVNKNKKKSVFFFNIFEFLVIDLVGQFDVVDVDVIHVGLIIILLKKPLNVIELEQKIVQPSPLVKQTI